MQRSGFTRSTAEARETSKRGGHRGEWPGSCEPLREWSKGRYTWTPKPHSRRLEQTGNPPVGPHDTGTTMAAAFASLAATIARCFWMRASPARNVPYRPIGVLGNRAQAFRVSPITPLSAPVEHAAHWRCATERWHAQLAALFKIVRIRLAPAGDTGCTGMNRFAHPRVALPVKVRFRCSVVSPNVGAPGRVLIHALNWSINHDYRR